MVVFIHVDFHDQCPAYLRWTVGIIETGFCTLAVPTFFLISGFLLAGHADEKGWWRNAVRKRLLTLSVPYLLWGTLFWLFDYFRSHDLSLPCLLRSLGLTTCDMPGLYPLWFVRSLFAIVVISPLLVWFVTRLRSLFLALMFVLMLAMPMFADCDSTALRVAKGIFSIPSGTLYFSIGIYLRLYGLPSVNFRKVLIPMGIAGIILTTASAVLELSGYLTAPKYCRMIAIPLLLLAFFKLVPDSKWPTWLTRCAFPIFLLHVFSIGIYNNFLLRETNGLTAFAAKYVFAVALPIVAVVILRKLSPRLPALLFGGRG